MKELNCFTEMSNIELQETSGGGFIIGFIVGGLLYDLMSDPAAFRNGFREGYNS